jgi:hypothetical protein
VRRFQTSQILESLVQIQSFCFFKDTNLFHPRTYFRRIAKLRKPIIGYDKSIWRSVSLSLCPSAWNKSAPTTRTIMKIHNWRFIRKSVRKIQVSLKSDKNNRYFTRTHMYVYDRISLHSSRMRNAADIICRENKKAHFIFNNLLRKPRLLTTHDKITRRRKDAILHAGWLRQEYKHTLRIFNTYCCIINSVSYKTFYSNTKT